MSEIVHRKVIELTPSQKIYFASDFHLGAPDLATSHARERRLVAWLDSIKHDARLICLVGDIFDFWYEHRRVVPRGFVRLLGKLAALTDAGVEIIAFPGNHDMWMRDYFETELNIKTYREPLELVVGPPTPERGEKFAPPPGVGGRFFITHGDGRGPGDYAYKVLKRVF
nr:UDP-2,3-diacylglucosamine diphosphatase [Spirosomataceae bacterium]